MQFEGAPPLVIEYNSRNWLPTATARNNQFSPNLNLCITSDANQNLSTAKRRLLHWYYRFGHRNIRDVQMMLREAPFGTGQFLSSNRVTFEERPLCEICRYAKARRKAAHGKIIKIDKVFEGDLKHNHFHPGDTVATDHSESRIKKRTLSSFGRITLKQYVGGCLFVDHMSSYIHVEHQLGFSSSENIRAKQAYESHYLDHGIMVDSYLANNGVFKATAFIQYIRDSAQRLQFCGVNAHHQNGMAERAVKMISDTSRAMILHASVR